MKIKSTIKLIAAILICLGAGLIGSVFTSPAIPTWYAALQKPIFNPPNWIFAPVWTTLFILMGISAFLVWERGIKKKKVKIALVMFSAQLMLNILWSLLFFGLRSPFYAFIEIIALWLAIILTILRFKEISKPAALLMLPYIIWVSFAAVLNIAIFALN